jgi:hypothetical protein
MRSLVVVYVGNHAVFYKIGAVYGSDVVFRRQKDVFAGRIVRNFYVFRNEIPLVFDPAGKGSAQSNVVFVRTFGFGLYFPERVLSAQQRLSGAIESGGRGNSGLFGGFDQLSAVFQIRNLIGNFGRKRKRFAFELQAVAGLVFGYFAGKFLYGIVYEFLDLIRVRDQCRKGYVVQNLRLKFSHVCVPFYDSLNYLLSL